jgi:hypothetical protein
MKAPRVCASTGFLTLVTDLQICFAALTYARRLAGMWAVGDTTGLFIPADAQALREGGADFLTEAFRRFGSLAPDKRVSDITECVEVSGGSTGRKLRLDVEYRRPGPSQALFVKFSRDLDDPARDHGRTQMQSEIRFAALSSTADFPIVVPTAMFADYHRESGTGVLITERIPFGVGGIEPQHEKCMDYLMSDQPAHYRALLTAVATLAGTQKAARLRLRCATGTRTSTTHGSGRTPAGCSAAG